MREGGGRGRVGDDVRGGGSLVGKLRDCRVRRRGGGGDGSSVHRRDPIKST